MKKIIVLYIPSHHKEVVSYTQEYVSISERCTQEDVLFIQFCPDINELYCNDLSKTTLDKIAGFLKNIVEVKNKIEYPQLLTMIFKDDNLITTFAVSIWSLDDISSEIDELLAFQLGI